MVFVNHFAAAGIVLCFVQVDFRFTLQLSLKATWCVLKQQLPGKTYSGRQRAKDLGYCARLVPTHSLVVQSVSRQLHPYHPVFESGANQPLWGAAAGAWVLRILCQPKTGLVGAFKKIESQFFIGHPREKSSRNDLIRLIGWNAYTFPQTCSPDALECLLL